MVKVLMCPVFDSLELRRFFLSALAPLEIKKAAASEILKVRKLCGGQKIQDAISKFLEELGNLLNELNNAV
jgi:hypothetical protein